MASYKGNHFRKRKRIKTVVSGDATELLSKLYVIIIYYCYKYIIIIYN